jgi:hypothetical protein
MNHVFRRDAGLLRRLRRLTKRAVGYRHRSFVRLKMTSLWRMRSFAPLRMTVIIGSAGGQTAGNATQKFLCRFSWILGGEVLVQNHERDSGINFL